MLRLKSVCLKTRFSGGELDCLREESRQKKLCSLQNQVFAPVSH